MGQAKRKREATKVTLPVIAEKPFEEQFSKAQLKALVPPGVEPLATRLNGHEVHVACDNGRVYVFGRRELDKITLPPRDPGPLSPVLQQIQHDLEMIRCDCEEYERAKKDQQQDKLDRAREAWKDYQKNRELPKDQQKHPVLNFNDAWEIAQARCDEALIAGHLAICQEVGCNEKPSISLVIRGRALLMCADCATFNVGWNAGCLDADPDAWKVPSVG